MLFGEGTRVLGGVNDWVKEKRKYRLRSFQTTEELERRIREVF